MDIRLATAPDLPAVQDLLDGLYVDNLPEAERAQGFLSARFTPGDLAEMVAGTGIVVAADGTRIVGALCLAQWRAGEGRGVLGAMSRAIEAADFEGRPLTSRRLIVCGPVAIAPSHRGRHLLRALYDGLLRHAAGRWDIGVAYVAHANPHSMHAHVNGLGMTRAAEFENEGRGYTLLIFRIPPSRPGGVAGGML
jgi:hypothetical protein